MNQHIILSNKLCKNLVKIAIKKKSNFFNIKLLKNIYKKATTTTKKPTEYAVALVEYKSV